MNVNRITTSGPRCTIRIPLRVTFRRPEFSGFSADAALSNPISCLSGFSDHLLDHSGTLDTSLVDRIRFTLDRS